MQNSQNLAPVSARALVFPALVEKVVELRGQGPLCRSCSYYCADLADLATNQCTGRSEGADGCDLGEYDGELLRIEFARARASGLRS